MAACTMCPNEIAEPRQIVAPHTLTCSPACAQERDRCLQSPAGRTLAAGRRPGRESGERLAPPGGTGTGWALALRRFQRSG